MSVSRIANPAYIYLLFLPRLNPSSARNQRDHNTSDSRPRESCVVCANTDSQKSHSENKKNSGYITAVHFHQHLTFASNRVGNAVETASRIIVKIDACTKRVLTHADFWISAGQHVLHQCSIYKYWWWSS